MRINDQKVWGAVARGQIHTSEEGQLYVMLQDKEEEPIRTFLKRKLQQTPLPGTYFYELSRKSFVSREKRLVLYSRETNRFLYGANIREVIGAEGDIYMEPAPADPDGLGFIVFVQSMSTNRKVKRGDLVIGPVSSLTTVPTDSGDTNV